MKYEMWDVNRGTFSNGVASPIETIEEQIRSSLYVCAGAQKRSDDIYRAKIKSCLAAVESGKLPIPLDLDYYGTDAVKLTVKFPFGFAKLKSINSIECKVGFLEVCSTCEGTWSLLRDPCPGCGALAKKKVDPEEDALALSSYVKRLWGKGDRGVYHCDSGRNLDDRIAAAKKTAASNTQQTPVKHPWENGFYSPSWED